MKVIGITGNSGSGKSLASEVLSNIGCLIINLDKVGHKIYENKNYLEKLKNEIPGNYIENNTISRKELSNIVFSNYEYLKKLTNISDEFIFEEVVQIINSNKSAKLIVLDGALIFDSKTLELCESVIIIDANREIRINRIINRDNISYENACKRVDSQKKYLDFDFKSKYLVLNNGNEEEFKNTIIDILKNKIIL